MIFRRLREPGAIARMVVTVEEDPLAVIAALALSPSAVWARTSARSSPAEAARSPRVDRDKDALGPGAVREILDRVLVAHEAPLAGLGV